MAEGNIYYAEQDERCVIRFGGAISFTLGNALDRFLDGLFARPEIRTIIVDLTATESIDSTGLGMLARIAKFVRQRDGVKPVLFSTHPDINALLNSICLDEAFVLCDQNPEVHAEEALPAGEAADREVAQTVLDAHRLLCEMNETNRARFQSVVDSFERDLGTT